MFVKEITVMNFENYFPLWNDLNIAQKKIISDNLITRDVKKGTIIHNGNLDCTGLLLVKTGQLRTYILSDEGREITLYRLFDMDMCLLSASCIIRSIQFEVTIEAEKDTDLWIIPAEIYKDIMKESAPVANYTNELMATRFSDVMWLIEQIMWKSLDKRVASFLLEETSIEGTNELKPLMRRLLIILVPTGKLSLECSDTFKEKDSSDSPAEKSQSLIRKDWKHYKDHKTVFL